MREISKHRGTMHTSFLKGLGKRDVFNDLWHNDLGSGLTKHFPMSNCNI